VLEPRGFVQGAFVHLKKKTYIKHYRFDSACWGIFSPNMKIGKFWNCFKNQVNSGYSIEQFENPSVKTSYFNEHFFHLV
jgi:hypothetical protein